MKKPDIILENQPLAMFTSWLVGGPAQYLAIPRTKDDVFAAVGWAWQNDLPLTVLGGGSNVLISDAGIEGLTLCLRQLSGTQVSEADGRLRIWALAGTSKSELLKIFLKYKLVPALFLAGLPGDVGGGVAMNAGVSENLTPREFGELVDTVEILPLKKHDDPKEAVRKMQHDELVWNYRHSEGWRPGIILQADLSWPLEPNPDVLAKVRDLNKIRISKQPLHLPSCGSVFVNPPGNKSGRLIDECGLRGLTIGGAQISEKHANFIVNINQAKALDIHRLIETARQTVKEKTGIVLQTEVVYLGRWNQEIQGRRKPLD